MHSIRLAFRRLRRHPGFTLLNASGLAIGLACALLALFYIRDETRVDRFHQDADRIYSVVMTDTLLAPETPLTPYPLGLALAEQAEVVSVMRASRGSVGRMRVAGQADEVRERLLMTDAGFFDFFSFPLLGGAPSPLAEPDGLVLTPTTAGALFGEVSPLGQIVEVFKPWPQPTWVPLRVTAVAAAPPAHSTIGFGAVARYEALRDDYADADRWGMSSYLTYVRLAPGVDGAAFAAGFPDRVKTLDPIADNWNGRRFITLPLTDMYLSGIEDNSAFTGQAAYMKLFGAIALVILLIAVLNYVNLATASGMRMAREVGVRKAVGAERGQVARGLLAEAQLLVALSLVLSAVLVALALPLVNAFFGKGIAAFTTDALPIWASAVGLMIGVGLLAGAYPALALSRFSPARVLRSGRVGDAGGTWLRRGLVVTQFAATIGLLVFTASVFRQLDHVESRYPMAEDSRLAVLDLESEWIKRSSTVESALSSLPGVTGTAASTGVPGQIGNRYGYTPPGGDIEIIAGFFGDRDFAALIGLPMAHQSAERSGPEAYRLFVNEQAMERAGLDWSPGVAFPLGLAEGGVDARETTPTAGVLADFPYESLRTPVEPLFYGEAPDTSRFEYVVTRIDRDSVQAFQAALGPVWTQFSGAAPEITFVDDYVAALYEGERKLAQLVTLLAVVGLLVACLGLLGLAAHAAAQKRKEISVRKVLGAGVGNLVGRMTREFSLLIGVAFLVASPISYALVSDWLEGFTERTSVGPDVFAGVLALVLALALTTVSWHAWHAATRNPADVLRAE